MTEIDLAHLQRQLEERAAMNWDPDELKLLTGAARLRRTPAEVDLEALQREAEVRAQAFWDPVEEPMMAPPDGGPRPAWDCLATALDNLNDVILNTPNKTPFLGPAYRAKYLRSEHWRTLRDLKLARAGGHCARCRQPSRRLEVHHLTYRNLGQEHEDELIVLCHGCHEAEHGSAWE